MSRCDRGPGLPCIHARALPSHAEGFARLIASCRMDNKRGRQRATCTSFCQLAQTTGAAAPLRYRSLPRHPIPNAADRGAT
jgi:hypothetical protein